MRRARVAAAVSMVLLAASVVVAVAVSAAGHAPTTAEQCRAISAASALRRAEVSGTGSTVAVIGDSYAQGLGLDDPRTSWPSRLPGSVVVDGFSGSGFSDAASPCPREAYYHRVARALATDPGLVVLQGGLNEYDVPEAEIRRGLHRALRGLAGRTVVMVGPPTAPRRATAVARVDTLLAGVAARRGIPYVRTSSWRLEYLPDQLHLTSAGHAAFGDGVTSALADLRASCAIPPTARHPARTLAAPASVDGPRPASLVRRTHCTHRTPLATALSSSRLPDAAVTS